MDTFGHEVAVKIKSAIKAKLTELNSYVDDELPDYIMVMVANKKPKTQMSSDLALFLGENATKFCEWLDEVLKRIQSVTIEPHRKIEIDLQSRSEENSISADNEATPLSDSNHKEDKAKQEVEILDEVLAIKAETDDLLVDELNKDDADKTVNSVDDRKLKNLTIENRLPSKLSPVKVAITTTENEVKRPERNISPIVIDENMSSQPITTISGSRKRKIPLSTVGAVLKREFPQEDDDDEYNFRHLNPGAVASVVQVSKRRPTLPPEKQANTNLLLKAVNDAQKSVLLTNTKPTGDGNGKKKLFTKSYLERTERLQKLTEKRNEAIKSRSLALKNEAESENANNFGDNLKEEPSSPSSTVVDITDNAESNLTDCAIVLQEKKRRHTPSPEFIITLDGVDGNAFTGGEEEAENDEEMELSALELDSDLMQSTDADDDEVTMGKDDSENNSDTFSVRCKYWPVCKNGNQCNYHHPTILCKTFPACKFGNQCLFIHPNCKFDATCTKNDCPFTHASPRNSFDSANKNKLSIGMKKSSSILTQSFQSKTVCRNFPSCKNVDCTFHHPKPCRYGHGCTRNDCIFFHPSFPAADQMKWKAKGTSDKQLLIESSQLE